MHRHVIQADLTWLSPAQVHDTQQLAVHVQAESCRCIIRTQLAESVLHLQSFVKGGKDALPIEGVKLSQLICQTRTGRLYRGTLKGELVHIMVSHRHACS